MNKVLITAAFVLLLPFGGAGAFQIISPEQMDESGLNLDERGYFSHYNSDVDQGAAQMQFLGNRRYDGVNYHGRRDGGGRFLGDNRRSNFRGCANSDSNVGQLNALGGTGYAYPCQRFR